MIDLSIIIPSFNTRELLIKCLDSIIKETKTPFEIIVVDNGSTDGTVGGIREIRGIRVIENKENLGFAKAINQGLKVANGKYILLLNSDTEILDGAIDKEIRFLETHQEVGVVGCQLKNADGSIQYSGGYLPNLFNVFLWMSFIDDLPVLNNLLPAYHMMDKEFYTYQRYMGWVTGAFFLTKREVYKKVGLFDEDIFMYVEEIDWCTRVKKVGFSIAFDPNGKVLHYKGASGEQGKAGIAEEFNGLKYYFTNHKPAWQLFFLRLLLKIGAWARWLIFGIIGQDFRSRTIYGQLIKDS